MARIGQTIRDKRVLRLIGRYLRAGVMIEGVVQASEEGTPQGGALSPLLANIYLDALDQELEGRGLTFSRYAHDCNIYVSSQRSAERVLVGLTEWIKKHLRLEVHATKSGVGRPWERKFLGFRINPEGKIEAAPQRVWNGSKRKCGRGGEAARVRPARSCGTTGAPTCEAGGAITGWPSNEGTSTGWRAGSGDTFAAASGSGGTTGAGDYASCGGWD